MIYLDGNSLGRLPTGTIESVELAVRAQWGERLIRGWNEGWIELPFRLGAKIAKLLGARSGEVVVCDSTSVNLYKLATAAVRAGPTGARILTDNSNFPSDIYILQGVSQAEGVPLEVVEPDVLLDALVPGVGLVSLSHTAFKSGAIRDMGRIDARAHEVGALTLWDLSHSAGAIPLSLSATGADLAVGCGYKYLNGGPGAPAFLYVREGLQGILTNPIQGWMGQSNPFEFGLEYRAVDGIGRWLSGTPSVLGLVALETGLDLLLEAGMERIRAKSLSMTDLVLKVCEDELAHLGFQIATPSEPAARGSHVSLAHRDAWPICRALIDDCNVIPDFRTPDNVRLGVAPLYNTYCELVEGLERMASLVSEGRYDRGLVPSGVT